MNREHILFACLSGISFHCESAHNNNYIFKDKPLRQNERDRNERLRTALSFPFGRCAHWPGSALAGGIREMFAARSERKSSSRDKDWQRTNGQWTTKSEKEGDRRSLAVRRKM